MKKSFFILLLAVIGFTATSCSSTFQSMKEASSYIELTANDYTLSDQFTGEATVTKVFNVDWMRLFNKKIGSFNAHIVGLNIRINNDAVYAIYDLMEKHPGYDFVMYPQFTTYTEGVPGLYSNTTGKVTARLGKLKK